MFRFFAFIVLTQNPTSTKTRIKTYSETKVLPLLKTSQNPTSTKTRIKTQVQIMYKRYECRLRTQLPLKQGLRHLKCVKLCLFFFISQNPTSTKTRIKTKAPRLFDAQCSSLRTQLPLKQGLRLNDFTKVRN